MKITREMIRSWGIEVPMREAVKRYGLPNGKNKSEWVTFLAGLFEFMTDERQW